MEKWTARRLHHSERRIEEVERPLLRSVDTDSGDDDAYRDSHGLDSIVGQSPSSDPETANGNENDVSQLYDFLLSKQSDDDDIDIDRGCCNGGAYRLLHAPASKWR